MEFAEILRTLLPNASRATIEVGGHKITIETQSQLKPGPVSTLASALDMPPPALQAQIEEAATVEELVTLDQIGVAMEDIPIPVKPTKPRQPRVHRPAGQLHRDREHVYALVQGSGRSGMTSRDLVAAGVPISTVHSDLRWLVMQGRIMRSGDSYYTV
jgi:hypothetical protein